MPTPTPGPIPRPPALRAGARKASACLAVAFGLGLAAPAQAALKDGIVAYWPLDEVVGTKTPDLVSGYDMELVNLTAADLVAGKRGKAFNFVNSRQTMLKRVDSPGEQLPINQFPALTVSFWCNVTGTGNADLRLFSEGNTANNNPLFNLGTANGGADNSLDIFFRQTGWTDVNHLHSVGQPLDGTWHHVTFTQETDGTRALYLDGVKDDLEIPAKEPGAWSLNTTTIGGILRANPTHWLNGAMDDVALWNRALSPAEVTQLVNEGLVSVFPPIAKGMVAYWPLDEIIGVKTPDLVNGYDMELVNLTAADLVAGKRGKAFKFENARQTMLKRVNSPGEQLPVNQFPALTVSLWANVVGTGNADLRLFSEGNTANNNPLFNLGTANGGADNSLDIFFRQTGWTDVNHLHSVGQPLDGTWHHVTFTQQTDGTRALYLDGVKDDLEIPAKEAGAWSLNTTTLGGILRANPTHWLNGQLDDVALWNRALAADEIKSIFDNGTPVPFSKPQPLAIRAFTSDLPAVAAGDSVTLRWDVTKNVQVAIDNGVGDVTAKTVSGLGSVDVPLTQSKTFTLTLTRGTETLTQTLAVAAIAEVASGWTLLDNFDRYSEGNLTGHYPWADLTQTGFSVVAINGNPMLAPNGPEVGAVLPLRSLTINEGQKRTLFFRVYTRGDAAEALRGEVILTDRRLRFGNESNNGLGVRLSDEQDDLDRLGGVNGYQGTLELFDPALDELQTYNVWVDVNNGPFVTANPDQGITGSTGDTYSVHVQKVGGAARTTIIQDYAADRDPVGVADTGFTLPILDSLAIIARASHSTTKNLLFDDFYLSKSGYLTSVPRALGATTPIPSEPPSLTVKRNGTQIEVSFKGGTLESAPAINGPWSAVSGANSPYSAATDAAQRYFRAKQ